MKPLYLGFAIIGYTQLVSIIIDTVSRIDFVGNFDYHRNGDRIVDCY